MLNLLLQRYFGFELFQKNQIEVVEKLLAGKSVILNAPPAWGKTLLMYMWAILHRDRNPRDKRPLLIVLPLDAVFTNHIAVLKSIIERSGDGE